MSQNDHEQRGRRFESRRKDGRFASTAGFVHHLTRRARPALAFDPRTPADEFPAWRRRVRARLRSLLALPPPAPRPGPRLVRRERRDGYRLQRWEMYPERGCVVPFLMLVPDTATERRPAPAVLCFPGTDHSKELLAGEPESEEQRATYHRYPAHPARERMGLHLARAGFVALCVDNPGTQESGDPACPGRTELCGQLMLLGRNYLGLCVHQAQVLCRWLRDLPFVDRRRIAACGHSLGSTRALALGVIEPRIAAVVNNGHLGSTLDAAIATGLVQSPLWHVVPGMLRWFDRADLAAAMAPRPLLIGEGVAPRHAARIRKAYSLMNARGRLKIVYSPRFEAKAKRRRRTTGRLPEGLTREQLKENVLLDSDFHYFKPEIAVPWLLRVLRCE